MKHPNIAPNNDFFRVSSQYGNCMHNTSIYGNNDMMARPVACDILRLFSIVDVIILI